MKWEITTNKDCTEFYANSEEYDVNITASSMEKLQEVIKSYEEFFNSLENEERSKLIRKNNP